MMCTRAMTESVMVRSVWTVHLGPGFLLYCIFMIPLTHQMLSFTNSTCSMMGNCQCQPQKSNIWNQMSENLASDIFELSTPLNSSILFCAKFYVHWYDENTLNL